MSERIEIEEGRLLAPLTTLRIGGPARFYCEATTEEELVAAVWFARERGLAVFPLGGGSNLLVSDGGFDGLVVRVIIGGPVVRSEVEGGVVFDVPAGVEWDGFVRQACEAGLAGVECLAGIPGLVGGTPVQNVGAYGQEVAETIVAVSALDLESLELVTLGREACGFGYRRSVFNSSARGRYIVTRVRFRLDVITKARLAYADLQRHFSGLPEPSLLEVYEAVRSIRRAKGMLLVEGDPDCRSAGSFFKNPVVSMAALRRVAEAAGVAVDAVPNWPVSAEATKLPAAWLVERAGFYKGFAMGRVGISSRHTLALVNLGGASFAELAALRDAVVAGVERRFEVRLEQEPVQIGC